MAYKIYVNGKLKRMRESKNLTQQEFVSIMEVMTDEPISLSVVQKLEQGVRPINPELLLDIAKYFKVEPKQLVERK